MSMSNSQAADEVRKILKGFRAVEQVSEALEKVGSLENAAKEVEKQLYDLRAKCDQAQTELDAAIVNVNSAKEDSKRIRAEATAKAQEKIAKAEVDAAKIVADAKKSADIADGNVTACNAQLAEIDIAVKSATDELEAIEKKIAAAKKQVASILG